MHQDKFTWTGSRLLQSAFTEALKVAANVSNQKKSLVSKVYISSLTSAQDLSLKVPKLDLGSNREVTNKKESCST